MAAKNQAIPIVVVTLAALNGVFLFGNRLFMLLAPSIIGSDAAGQGVADEKAVEKRNGRKVPRIHGEGQRALREA